MGSKLQSYIFQWEKSPKKQSVGNKNALLQTIFGDFAHWDIPVLYSVNSNYLCRKLYISHCKKKWGHLFPQSKQTKLNAIEKIEVSITSYL